MRPFVRRAAGKSIYQWDALPPDAFRKAIERGAVTVRSSPRALRGWQIDRHFEVVRPIHGAQSYEEEEGRDAALVVPSRSDD